MPSNLPVLKTERAIIRLAMPEEASLVADYFLRNNEHIGEFSNSDERLTHKEYWHKELSRRIEHLEENKSCHFFALTPNEDQVIASAHYFGMISRSFQACFLSYSVDKAYEGQGFMKEVLVETTSYMFSEHNIHRIMGNYHPDNKRSANTLASLGFEIEGLARDYLYIKGKWCDHILSSLLNPSWVPESTGAEVIDSLS